MGCLCNTPALRRNIGFFYTVNNRSQFLQDMLSVSILCSTITNSKDDILNCGYKDALIMLLVLFSDFQINTMQKVLKNLSNFVLSPFNIAFTNLKWVQLWPIVFSRNWY